MRLSLCLDLDLVAGGSEEHLWVGGDLDLKQIHWDLDQGTDGTNIAELEEEGLGSFSRSKDRLDGGLVVLRAFSQTAALIWEAQSPLGLGVKC